MRSCIITFNIHNICFVGWRDSLLVLFVICSNYAFPLIKKKKHKTHKKTSNTRCHVIIPIVYETHRKTTCFFFFNTLILNSSIRTFVTFVLITFLVIQKDIDILKVKVPQICKVQRNCLSFAKEYRFSSVPVVSERIRRVNGWKCFY